jgi:PEP-CTERM motif
MTKRILLIVAAMILGLVSNAQAIPILGDVDLGPGYNPSTTTAGTATYTFFNVDDPQTSYNLIGLNLTFEGDVFDLNLTFVDPTSLPVGWSVTTVGLGNYEFEFVGGLPGIPEGAALTFDVDYTLLDIASSLLWDEGGAWEQGFAAISVPSSGLPIPIVTGGSTSPAPEPTSILLLGAGLAGLGFLGRRRFRARS